jgi:hypothetical protein
MSADNGVIKVPRFGKMKYELEGYQVIEFDTIEVHDEWWVIDQSFRDTESNVPVDQTCAYNMSKLTFVQNIFNKIYQGGNGPVLTHGEAAKFIVEVQKEVLKIRDFLDQPSPDQPTSPLPMDVRFSQ